MECIVPCLKKTSTAGTKSAKLADNSIFVNLSYYLFCLYKTPHRLI